LILHINFTSSENLTDIERNCLSHWCF